MISTFFYLQKNKLNITKISKLLFFAIIVILQNTINSKLSRSYAYDVTCSYRGTVCSPNEPVCHSDDFCTHYRYVYSGVCNNGQTEWNSWVCPENCHGFLPPGCSPSGGGGGGGGDCVCDGEGDSWCANGGICGEGGAQCAPAGAWPCGGSGPTCIPASCRNCTPVNGVLSAFSSCPVCDYGTQTATCISDPSCGGATCSSLCSTAGGTYSGTTCTRDCSTSCPPIGYHDGAECIDDEGPNLRKIRVWGWACDKSDYSKPLTIHSYLDGVYGAGGTFINPAGSASNSGEVGIANACGGFPNHRFNYISTSSYPSGTHSVYSFAINIGAYPDANPLLTTSPKTVNCCTPNNPSLVWGSCSGGTQLATCNPPPYCGGSCSAECIADGGTYDFASHTCTRNCFSIEGYIWSDDNGITGKQAGDNFKAATNHPDNCYTNKIFPGFYMTATSEIGNQISDDNWVCRGSTNGAYYSTPYSSTTKSIEPESTKTFSLTTIPSYYDYVGWEFWYHNGASAVLSNSGTGSMASNLVMPATANWLNIHWKLSQETYNLRIKVKDIPPEIDAPNCGNLGGYDDLKDAVVTVRDIDGNPIPSCPSGNTDGSGYFTCEIWRGQGDLRITVSKSIAGNTPETYQMKCPSSSTEFTISPGIPAKDSTYDSPIVGLRRIRKRGWVSSIDADIFAELLSVVVPDGPTDNSDLPGQTPQGFAKTLINSSGNNNTSLGFAFSESNDRSNPNVDTSCPNSKGFETIGGSCTNLGGFSYNLISGGEHDSKWLESFTFTPPSNVEVLSSLPNSFSSDEIYQISGDDFNNKLDDGPFNYSITGDNNISILYVDGDITIPNSITASNPDRRLLIVVDGSVTIDEGVGTTLTYLASSINYMLQNPHIMAGMIASGKITFESIPGTKTETNRDKMIVVSAPLITSDSTDGIIFGRDLYHGNNATIPAESAKAFNKYLYLLSSLEREKSQDYLYFTGVTTFDLDWEYIY